MTAVTHLALDLALSTTGIAWGPNPTDCCVHRCPSKLAGGARLSWWRKRIREHLVDDKRPRITRVVVEAPVIHPNHRNGAIPLIKLHGAVEHQAWTAGVGFDATIAPASLKKWATGSGRADKDLMMAAARDRFGWTGSDDNEADAVLLWHYVAEVTR